MAKALAAKRAWHAWYEAIACVLGIARPSHGLLNGFFWLRSRVPGTAFAGD